MGTLASSDLDRDAIQDMYELHSGAIWTPHVRTGVQDWRMSLQIRHTLSQLVEIELPIPPLQKTNVQ